MENEIVSMVDLVKEEQEDTDETEYPAYISQENQPGKSATLKPMATVHHHPVSSSTPQLPEKIDGTDSIHLIAVQGRKRLILPRPTNPQYVSTPNQSGKRGNQVGDYLEFVFWVRSLLQEMYPSLAELPMDVPLFAGLKWPDRHAWGRKVDEQCPSHWRRFRLKEAKRLSALSKRCFSLMMSIGKKIIRGDMKRSTISREAGSTTFDFLTKKTEGEMFQVLTLIESGQLYIKDANAFARSHREKRGPQNDDEFSEDSGLYTNTDVILTASPRKQSRRSNDSPLGSIASASDELPTMAYSEDSRSEDMPASSTGQILYRIPNNEVDMPASSTGNLLYRAGNNEEDGRLAKVIDDLKRDLKETREQLLKAQENVHELEEENEVLSSLLTDNRAFQQQQQELFNRRIKFKDEIIRRLKRDIDELTNSGVENERNTVTTMNEGFSNNIENSLNQSEKAFEHCREEIKVDDFVLYHTCNGKFYMGKAMDVSHQSGLLLVQYGESKDGINYDFSNWKTTFVSKESVCRWGNIDDVGASCIRENLYRLTAEQVNLAQ